MSALDPLNDIDNEDYSEVEVCRWCRELIEPGSEVWGNGWAWHTRCAPVDVIAGLEQKLRDDERKHSA